MILDDTTVLDGVWPPPDYRDVHDQIDEHAAWWEGTPEALNAAYQRKQSGRKIRPSQYDGGLAGTMARIFWGRPKMADETPRQLHIPLAADLAQTSAEQLYSTPPTISIPDDAPADAHAVVDRLVDFNLHNELLAGAEAAAALGGRYHTITRDAEINDGYPFITTTHPDRAYPTFRWGELVSVSFENVVEKRSGVVFRHIETHRLDGDGCGIIEHTLWEGTQDTLGARRPLTDHAVTGPLADSLADDGITVDPELMPRTPGLLTAYVPNMRPNRAWRRSPVARHYGRSDYDGIESLLHELDLTWSEWMDELEAARSRVLVSAGLVEAGPAGAGSFFNAERRLFTSLPGSPGGGPQRSLSDDLQVVQFNLDVDRYARTVAALTETIVRSAGWSQATFGEHDGDTDVTATEIKAREKRTLTKRGRKIGYETTAIRHLTGKALTLAGHDDIPVMVEFANAVEPSTLELAQYAAAMRAAGAVSRRTLVETMHPSWTQERVEQELADIDGDNMVTDPHIRLTPRTS